MCLCVSRGLKNEKSDILHLVPGTEGFYLLTVERAFCGKFIEPERELRIGYWRCNQFFAKLLDEERITAWAFSPSPFIKEQNDE